MLLLNSKPDTEQLETRDFCNGLATVAQSKVKDAHFLVALWWRVGVIDKMYQVMAQFVKKKKTKIKLKWHVWKY